MDIRQLIYFVEIAKAGTYSAAAKQLFISQPALSKAVRILEQDLGAKLLVQSDSKTVLTDVGRVLFDKAQHLIEDYNALIDAVSEVTDLKKGRMRFGVPFGLGTILFDRLTSGFAYQYPHIEISVSGHGSRHIREAIMEGKLDIGASIVPPTVDTRLEATPIMADKYFLLVNARHPLAARASVRFEELRDEQFVMFNDEFAMTEVTRKNCLAAGFTPKVNLIANRTELIADLVAKGRGIAAIAGGRWRFDKTPDLATVSLEGGELDFDIVLVTPAGGYLPHAVKRFIAFAREHASDMYK